jgi:hypothetical protein
MFYFVLGFIWLLLFVLFGIRTLTKGHWVMFLFGIIFPLLWLIGAFMPDHRAEDRVPETF